MNPAVILTITQGLNLIATFGPIAVGIALQIKKLFGSGSDVPFEVQIQAYQNGILKTLDETDTIIAEWRREHPE